MRVLRPIVLGLNCGLLVASLQILRANDVYVRDDTYFAVVPDKTLRAKFQIRLEAPVFSETNPHVWAPLHGLWLFYNQKSFWEIGQPSAPFSEHNFNPGAYYGITNLGPLRISAGFEHISNGLGGDDSRSLNRYFANPSCLMLDGHVELALRAWVFAGETEPVDLHRYWGYIRPAISFNRDGQTPEEDLQVKVSGHIGSDTDYYGIETSAMWPLRRMKFNPNLFVDWWYGYGERLLTLDKKESIIRVGVGFNLPGRETNMQGR